MCKVLMSMRNNTFTRGANKEIKFYDKISGNSKFGNWEEEEPENKAKML